MLWAQLACMVGGCLAQGKFGGQVPSLFELDAVLGKTSGLLRVWKKGAWIPFQLGACDMHWFPESAL